MEKLQDDLEKEILIRTANGDEEAFRIIYDGYRDRIYAFSTLLTRSEFLAEDIVQEVFLKIWQYRKNLVNVQVLGPYLQAIFSPRNPPFCERLKHEKLRAGG